MRIRTRITKRISSIDVEAKGRYKLNIEIVDMGYHPSRQIFRVTNDVFDGIIDFESVEEGSYYYSYCGSYESCIVTKQHILHETTRMLQSWEDKFPHENYEKFYAWNKKNKALEKEQ